MKTNRVIWGLISLLVLFTVIVLTGSIQSRGQERVVKKDPDATPKPTSDDDTRDLSKFGSVEFAGAESVTPNEERWRINERYNGQGWVFSSVNNPDLGAVGKITHDPILPPLPIDESLLIVTGEVVAVKTFLSNDRRGVYTEFIIKPDEVLKDSGQNAQKGIRADREGGVVVYPNGQRIMYQSSSLALPLLHGKYVFFLSKEGESPNYVILATYDVGANKVVRLEEASTGPAPELPEQASKAHFLDVVRNKIALRR